MHLLLLISLFTSNVEVYKAEAMQPATPIEIIQQASERWDVDKDLLIRVVNDEDPSWDPMKQSDQHYRFTDPRFGIVKGARENSWGAAMINLDYHPEITKEQAQNFEFSVNFLAKEIHRGNGDWWTCIKFKTCI